ncbi:Hypothetical predicted protein [Octopus vulgaris]|uniref:Uncharacterized protein n=1 Tax=Octopus vulgaris TaxID=6645 RepID=A0AA36B5F6_OCTVU|nr:Hypothetical predicted protein [Octopus vulgaris]
MRKYRLPCFHKRRMRWQLDLSDEPEVKRYDAIKDDIVMEDKHDMALRFTFTQLQFLVRLVSTVADNKSGR